MLQVGNFVISAGKLLYTAVGVITIAGPYIADWNHTHVKNPRWPPHAKFHNGQTMSMGAALGLTTLYYTWRQSEPSVESLNVGLLLGSLYYITGLTAQFYPGARAIDPEFGCGNPQLPIFMSLQAMIGVGYLLEMKRLAGLDKIMQMP